MRVFFLLPLLMSFFRSYACDCDYAGPFLQVARKTKLVSLVKVTRFLTFKDIYGEKTPMSMEVEVVDTYKGSTEHKRVIVWGDPGNLCRPYLSVFKEGNYYVLALNAGQPNCGHEQERVEDYYISICGAYWLSADMRSFTATGDVSGTNERVENISFKTLKKQLAKAVH